MNAFKHIARTIAVLGALPALLSCSMFEPAQVTRIAGMYGHAAGASATPLADAGSVPGGDGGSADSAAPKPDVAVDVPVAMGKCSADGCWKGTLTPTYVSGAAQCQSDAGGLAAVVAELPISKAGTIVTIAGNALPFVFDKKTCSGTFQVGQPMKNEWTFTVQYLANKTVAVQAKHTLQICVMMGPTCQVQLCDYKAEATFAACK